MSKNQKANSSLMVEPILIMTGQQMLLPQHEVLLLNDFFQRQRAATGIGWAPDLADCYLLTLHCSPNFSGGCKRDFRPIFGGSLRVCMT